MWKVVEVFKVKMMSVAKAAGKFVCEKGVPGIFVGNSFFTKKARRNPSPR